MVLFTVAMFKGIYFERHELQTAAALHLYCRNADGTYADSDLIADIIFDMRHYSDSTPLLYHGIETFLRNSKDRAHFAAWAEVVHNDDKWRNIAREAYWTWRSRKTDLVDRLFMEGHMRVSASVKGYQEGLREEEETEILRGMRNGGFF